jgi:hypothetical protein
MVKIIILLVMLLITLPCHATKSYGDNDEQWDEVIPKRPMRWYILLAPEARPLIRWRWV